MTLFLLLLGREVTPIYGKGFVLRGIMSRTIRFGELEMDLTLDFGSIIGFPI